MSKEAIDELKRLRSILSGITGLEDDDQEYIEDARKSVDRIIEALAEQPAQQQKEGFASPGGGYVPAIPRPMPLDWKLVPRKATPEMLKAMDECAQEGYGERLYAGMASSVYMAAWDASPVMGTLPEQPAQQQEPVAYSYTSRITGAQGFSHHPMPRFIDSESWDIQPLYTSQPAQRKPWAGLTDEDIKEAEWLLSAIKEHEAYTLQEQLLVEGVDVFARAIEAKLREKNQ